MIAALELWGEITDNSVVLSTLSQGFLPRFHSHPPSFAHRSKHIHNSTHRRLLEADLQTQLDNRQLIELDPASAPQHCSRARVIPKPNQPDKVRLIVDYRFINQHLEVPHFRCADLSEVHHLLEPGCHMVVLDLQDGYRHIPLHPTAQQLLSFNILGRTFQPTALNFGLASAPYIFTKVISAVIAHLRRQGLRVSAYLDDFLVAASTAAEAAASRDKILELLERLGLSVNFSKSALQPAQRVRYLGLDIDCSNGDPVFRVPRDKQLQVQEQARQLLHAASATQGPPLRDLQSFCGLTNFLSRAIRPARLYNREFFNCLRRHAKFRRPRGGGSARTANPRQRIPLSDQACRDLAWWVELPEGRWARACRPVIPPSFMTAIRLTTDASDEGWGCLFEDHVSGADRWSPETAGLHINDKELRAVHQALRLHQQQIRNRRVLILCDNTTVCHLLNTGTTRSTALLAPLRRVWDFLLSNNIDFHARYIPSAQNPADAPSRRVDAYGQQLCPNLFQTINRRWGPHQVDRFADSANAQLPAFHSFHQSPDATGLPDAFANDWGNQASWMYPPFPLVGRCIRHLQECRGWGTIVAPDWPGQAWSPLLQELATEVLDLNELRGVVDPAELHAPRSRDNDWFATHPPGRGQRHHKWRLKAFFLDFRKTSRASRA